MRKPLKNLFKDSNGFALMITIMIVSLIIPLALQFNTSTYFYRASAANLEYGMQLNCAAKSGIHYALAVLHEDALSTEYDSEQEAWAEPFESDEDPSYGNVKFRVGISDHSGRININKLLKQDDQGEEQVFDEDQRDILTRLLKSLEAELEEDEVGDIVNSIKDWIDVDDKVTDHWGLGAENTYYQELNKPYSCRNGPLETIGELSLIKGVDVIYDEIKDFLTVYGEGANININTADKKVLMALSDDLTDGDIAEITKYREEEENKDELNNIGWYKKAMWTNDDRIDPDLITTSSTHFEIISTGLKGDLWKKITGIVERKKEDSQVKFRVISRKVE